jgi:replicative DNA helicase
MSKIYSERVERHVLGGLIKHPKVFAEVDGFINEKDFYHNVHYTIFCVLRDSVYKNERIDEVLLATKIQNLGVAFKDDINIHQYISSITFTQITQPATIQACKELVKLRVRREIDETAERIADEVRNAGEKNVDEIVALCDSIYNDKISSYQFDEEPEKITDGLEDLLHERAESPEDDTGIVTPYEEFNRMYGGFKSGHVYSIASRPGEGKTTWLVDCGFKSAEINDIKVLYLDTEMMTEEIKFRLASSFTDIPSWYLETGNWSKNSDLISKVNNCDRLKKDSNFYHFHVSDKPIERVCSIIKRWYYSVVGRGNRCMIIYDYVKLTGEAITKNYMEYQIIGDKINQLKRVAEEVNAPVLTAIQLNRSGETRNRRSSDIVDDSSAFALSDRLQWIAAFTAIFRRKTLEEVAIDGQESGTHKLVPTKTRFQGKDAAGHRDFLRRTSEDGTSRFVPNFINFNVGNFAVDERGSLRHIIERENETYEVQDVNENDSQDVL